MHRAVERVHRVGAVQRHLENVAFAPDEHIVEVPFIEASLDGRFAKPAPRFDEIHALFVDDTHCLSDQVTCVEALQRRAVAGADACKNAPLRIRSEEHTSELQSLMRISYAVFCLKKKNNTTH